MCPYLYTTQNNNIFIPFQNSLKIILLNSQELQLPTQSKITPKSIFILNTVTLILQRYGIKTLLCNKLSSLLKQIDAE